MDPLRPARHLRALRRIGQIAAAVLPLVPGGEFEEGVQGEGVFLHLAAAVSLPSWS
jgi:hypothetical protein